MKEDNVLLEEELEEKTTKEETAQPMSLEDFLCANPVEDATCEVEISRRLQGFKFKLGSMKKKEYDGYLKACTRRGNNGRVIGHDANKMAEMVVINHCLYPDFKSTAFLSKVGAATPSEALYKVLKLGEVDALSQEALKFNGFDLDFKEAREQAKN